MSRKMKDSGIEWIGEIPEEWNCIPLKKLTNLITDGTHQTPNYIESGIPFLSIKDVSSGYLDFSNTKYITEEEHVELSKHAHVQKGDIIFTRIGTLGVSILVDTEDTFDIFVSLGLLKIKKNLINAKWLVYNLNSPHYYNYIQLVKAGGGTAAAKYNLSDVGSSMIIMPEDFNEQIKIANYLDHKIKIIDQTIEKQKQIFGKLKEYKQSVITEAVTKGLNPNVPMKDSSIEWIGEIPGYWEVYKYKYCFANIKNALRVGPFGSAIKGEDFIDSGYKVYNQRTVLDNDFVNGEAFISEEKFKELESFIVNPYDVLITTRGTIGKIAIAPKNVEIGVIHPCIIKTTLDSKLINLEYLKYIFNDTKVIMEQLVLSSNATTIAVVYSEPLKNVYFAVPSKEEQNEIVEFLDIKCAKIDAAIKSKEQAIEKLESYKKSLVYECVTGKREVK